jgi:hypothetical protein
MTEVQVLRIRWIKGERVHIARRERRPCGRTAIGLPGAGQHRHGDEADGCE